MSDTQLGVGIGMALFPALWFAMPTVLQGIAADEQAQAQSDFEKASAQAQLDEADLTASSLRKRNAIITANEALSVRKNGVDASGGSELELLVQNAGLREQEALDVELFGQNAASLSRSRAKAIKTGGRSALAGSILSIPGQALSLGASLLSAGGGGGLFAGGGSAVPDPSIGRAIAAGGPAR